MRPRIPAMIAVPAATLALAACNPAASSGSSPPASFTPAATPAASAATAPPPVAGTGQAVTFSWPASGAGGQPTTWRMTVLGVHALAAGPLDGQAAGYRDFCVDLKLALTGAVPYALYRGQLDPQWTWKGSDGQVIGGSNTGAPAFETAACQDLFPGSEDLAGTATAPGPGQYINGSEAFSVPGGAGTLWLDDNAGRPLAGIKYAG